MTNSKKAVVMLLLLTFAASILVTLPATRAQVPSSLKTYAFVEATPNPVGVGQPTIIRFGILQALADVFTGWSDITVTVVKPNDQVQTLGPFSTDSTGGSFTTFTPDQVGTYTLTTNFPEQPMPKDIFDSERGVFIPANTTMLESHSETLDLVVQQDRIPDYPAAPLPAFYWTRPVDAQLREWYPITGNWPTRPENSLALYNDDAPETAHVLWAKPLTTGGLGGGLYDGVPAGSQSGDAYEGKFQGSVIINGILYYNLNPAGFGGPNERDGIRAVDLHTGKELWYKPDASLSFGQVLYFNGFNSDGVFHYLVESAGFFTSTWTAYDPFTGDWQWTFTDVPSGVQTVGPSGEILIYVIDYANGRMLLWNSTACGLQNAGGGYALGADLGSWGNNVHMRTLNGSNPNCYTWNVSIPTGLTVGSSFGASTVKVYQNDRIVGVDFNQSRVRVWALNIKDLTRASTTTTKLYDTTWPAPAEWLSGFNTLHYTGATNELTDGVIAVWSKELRKHYGFSVADGRYLWETDSEYWSDAYGWGNAEHTWYFAYGKLFSVGVGGILYAYDLKTGDIAWNYTMSDPYHQPISGVNWWGWITLIADGKVYVGTAEHSAEQPNPRGGPFIALDAENGTEVWRVNGMFRATRWGGNGIIGDSIIATMDTYDQQIYAIGKGPTEVTVSAGPKSSVLGSSVVIEGTVMDISPGTASDRLTLRFPNGVPAVSDASMSDWMLYVYKQFGCPASATGVEVTLDVLDANGNYRNIGTATSDANGVFNFAWKPDIPGKYIVYATFAGSKAYYTSFAETAFVADEAAAPEPTPGYPQPIDNTMTIVGMGIAVIIAIAIVGVLLLRKR